MESLFLDRVSILKMSAALLSLEFEIPGVMLI